MVFRRGDKFVFFLAEDGIRDAQETRGLGDVYNRQVYTGERRDMLGLERSRGERRDMLERPRGERRDCLLYTYDAADEEDRL